MGHRNLCFQNQRRQSVKEGTAGTKDAREHDEVHRRAVRSGSDVEWTSAEATKQLQLSLGSALLTWANIPKGLKPEKFVSTINRYRCRKWFVKILDESEVKGTFWNEWYLPRHPVLSPIKPGNVRHVCNAAPKNKEVYLNDNLLAGSDLLHGFIGTIFRFREGPIALTADIEPMFLQVRVPNRIEVVWGSYGVQELTELLKYMNICVMFLELRVLQFVQTLLWSQCDWTTKNSIQ